MTVLGSYRLGRFLKFVVVRNRERASGFYYGDQIVAVSGMDNPYM